MAVELPKRFTQAWIERTVPTLSAVDADFVIAAMRAKGWSEQELQERVYPHVRTRRRSVDTAPVPHVEPGTGEAKPSAEEAGDPAPGGGAESRSARRRRLGKPSLTHISAFATVVGSVAAVLALFVPFTSEDKPPTTPKRTSASTRTAPASGARTQAKLLGLVPLSLRVSCARNEKLRKQFKASAQLSCRLPGASQVAYYGFTTPQAMNEAYTPSPSDTPAGPCGQKWNVESSYRVASKEVGSLRCYTRKGTAWVEWTRDDLLVYAYASRADGSRKKLFEAWNAAGPSRAPRAQ